VALLTILTHVFVGGRRIEWILQFIEPALRCDHLLRRHTPGS
jgi:hypothetical protein